jgi:CRP-like cAMP-binding protein
MVGEMPLRETLKHHGFTQGLPETQIADLAKMATEVSFDENDVIFADGQHSTAFYLLLTGSVVVELRTAVCVMAVQSLGPGQVFGWSSLLDRQDTLFQVRARERTSALRIDAARLKALCLADTALGVALFHRVLHVVAGRVKATELRFAEMCGIRV